MSESADEKKVKNAKKAMDKLTGLFTGDEEVTSQALVEVSNDVEKYLGFKFPAKGLVRNLFWVNLVSCVFGGNKEGIVDKLAKVVTKKGDEGKDAQEDVKSTLKGWFKAIEEGLSLPKGILSRHINAKDIEEVEAKAADKVKSGDVKETLNKPKENTEEKAGQEIDTQLEKSEEQAKELEKKAKGTGHEGALAEETKKGLEGDPEVNESLNKAKEEVEKIKEQLGKGEEEKELLQQPTAAPKTLHNLLRKKQQTQIG